MNETDESDWGGGLQGSDFFDYLLVEWREV
jgi:hypothetical protein